MKDGAYVRAIHKELTSDERWANPGLKGVAQFAWGLALRQLSQYHTPTGIDSFVPDHNL